MQSGNRTVWIAIAVVVLVVLLCCCVVVAAGVVAGLYAVPFRREGGFARMEESTETILNVGEAPTLTVENFAGNVTVRGGKSGQIRIIVTKRAVNSSGLNQIEVDVTERDDGVRVRTSRPGVVRGSMAVDLEIFVPADARLGVDNGAGNVRVDGASGPVAVETGAGEIDYEGEPQGDCTFDNGAGDIMLRLPRDVNVEVELTTGIGNINLGPFDVEGRTTRTEVDGVIGSEEDASIRAHTGAGNISLVRR